MDDIVGFRFNPTDREIMNYYLRHKMLGNEAIVSRAINEVNVYDFDPWDLPSKSKILSDDQVYYFFCPREKKYSNSSRLNRTTTSGYWKATGFDRKIMAKGGIREIIGMKKTLVFHSGRCPNGKKTRWVMHEYRPNFDPPGQMAYVVCKVMNNEDEMMNTVPSSHGGESSNCSLASESETHNPSISISSNSGIHPASFSSSEVNLQLEDTLESDIHFDGVLGFDLFSLPGQNGSWHSDLNFSHFFNGLESFEVPGLPSGAPVFQELESPPDFRLPKTMEQFLDDPAGSSAEIPNNDTSSRIPQKLESEREFRHPETVKQFFDDLVATSGDKSETDTLNVSNSINQKTESDLYNFLVDR